MLFRRSSRRRKDDLLRAYPTCRSGLVCPTDWEPSDDSHWRIELSCAECATTWESIVDDVRAARYDIELDRDVAVIQSALRELDLERMALEADAFVAALSRNLIEPADFTV